MSLRAVGRVMPRGRSLLRLGSRVGKRAIDKNVGTQNHSTHGEAIGENQPEPTHIVEGWVDEHGQYLFRYALPRVRDRHWAEELVQETFLAALKSIGSFRGESSPRTWLVTIMRRKIADFYRKRNREPEAQSIDASDPVIDSWFDQQGGWLREPSRCEIDPAELHERSDFWIVFEKCLGKLPERQAEAFAMRVMDDRKPDDVCKVLSITPTNLWVLLHRARARLRACLETNWFQDEISEND